jgi:VacB/RNase II family 3'-5' exoribonuclease
MNTSRPNMASLLSIARRSMVDHGLQPDFDGAAIRQRDSITQAATSADADVRDLRSLPWASIDNDNSLDLDQLSVAEPGSAGMVRILVAIADVDAIVTPGSPIDAHAHFNTTSVYTAAAIFPMLPEKLSTDLTSLGQDQERLAIVIDLTVAPEGTVAQSAVYRARVLNRAKLAYNSVAAWLQGTGPAPAPIGAVAGLDEQLHTQDRVAQALRAVRRARGALDLQTIEAEPVFDAQVLTDLRPDESNRAKQLIEEFMIAANGVTAKFLADRKFASLRRVLRDPERWDRIVALAKQYGGQLPLQPDALALNTFLANRRHADPILFPDLSLSIIKLLGSGEYVADLPGQTVAGHFGLAVSDYAHSTAPNRRYPDLITQRILKAALKGAAPPYTNEALQEIAARCTAQEKNAAKVERCVNKSAAAMLLATRIGAKFDAIVTGASQKGTWVRISGPTTEGKLVRGFNGLDVGDHVKVELIRTDATHGFIDFARAQ